MIRLLLYFSWLLLVFVPSAQADDPKPLITWYLLSFEPVHITKGENKGLGFADAQLDFYIKHLPEYQHKIIVANIPRIRNELQSKEHLVATPSHVGPLDRFGDSVLTSKTNLYAPPIGVVIRAEDTAIWKHKEKLSLEKDLIGRPELQAAIVKGAAEHIHSTVPDLIRQYNPKVTYLSDPDPQLYLKMVRLKRVDYTFTYPFAFQMITSRLGYNNTLRFLPLTEANEYIEARAFISRGPGSQELLKKINKIGDMKAFKKHTTEAILRYVPPSIQQETATKNGGPYE